MLKPSLQLRLTQQLTMTPQLQQAIRLLQLPIMELQTQIQEALDQNVPAPVLTLALLNRIQSRDDTAFYNRLLAALRNQFGGHAMKAASASDETP